MNFDEYVNYIAQKHRIAIAISVIRTKPKDLSMDEYLTQLQRKIKDMEFDPNETVCSDDFKFDDDEFTDQNQQEIPTTINNGNDFDYNSNAPLIHDSVNEDSQDDSRNSQTILNNFVFEGEVVANVVNVHETSLEKDLYPSNLLKEATDGRKLHKQTSQHYQNLSQLTYCESQELNTNKDYNNDTTICYNTAYNKHNNASENNDNNLTYLDSQATELYSLKAFTQNYTHVSQTQDDIIIISDKFIRRKVDNDQSAKMTQENAIAIENDVDTTITNKFTEDRNHSHNIPTECDYGKNAAHKECIAPIRNKLKFTEEKRKENDHNHSMEIQYDYDQSRTLNEYEPVYNRSTTAHNNYAINNATEECINIIDYTAIPNDVQGKNIEENCLIEQDQVRGVNNNFGESNEQCGNNENFEGNDNLEGNNEMEVDDKTDSDENSQAVTVPFKVLEELHRVKAFLNKKDRRYTDGYSTDSGYRSDSQVRNSFKSSYQSTMIWINQSAHCLFTYIMQSPVGFADIINDISQVLGQLIDKLHDEENYPPFLEELLETVDSLLRESHDGDNWAEDALITKDEVTHRLLLLNKSTHILKHSIEIITNILEKIHLNLTQDEQYELTNISQIESTCYIFHILEMFLKKYIKLKSSSQISQNSQEDKLPKRSSLTELWRKKWNPNYKEMSVYQENVTVCVLKKCSQILNKIIVECMDGYSLVSFAALQCFNLIQS